MCNATVLKYGDDKRLCCMYMCSGKECELFRLSGLKKQLEMSVTELPNVINEQLLVVTLDLKLYKR